MKLFFLLILFPLSYLFIQNARPLASHKQQSFSQLEKAKEALEFCKSNHYNTEFCVLVDMRIHSGKNRMFVWDFETKTAPVFSNTPDSHLSSLGKFKIGDRGYSQWGINVNYKLHGLEKTNKNAYKRYIVLHSWEMVSDNPTYPEGTPEGWGCPAVSNEMMKQLDKKLKTSTKHVLFWVFN